MDIDIEIAPDHAIAMVDDNPADLVFARTCMELSNLTNAWLEFGGGPEFLDYLARVKSGEHAVPGLVLLDINMPGMDGHQVLERVRSDPFFRLVPIFCMLTGSGERRERDRATQLGASSFVVKPETVEQYVTFFNTLQAHGSR